MSGGPDQVPEKKGLGEEAGFVVVCCRQNGLDGGCPYGADVDFRSDHFWN